MTATLSKSQAELPRLVEIASQGEDVVITVEGKPKARLTRAEVNNGSESVLDMDAWLKELEVARRKYTARGGGTSTEQILNEDRGDCV